MAERLWFDQDRAILRKWEDERFQLTGPVVQYYSLTRGANVDPLYAEPDKWVFDTPVALKVTITYQQMDNRQPAVLEEGETIDYDGECFVALDEWERRFSPTDPVVRHPKEGDVIYVTERDQYFDVVNAGKGGNVVDTGSYVGFKFFLRTKEKFEPERKTAT